MYLHQVLVLIGKGFGSSMSLKYPESKDSMFFENRIATEWISTRDAAAFLGITPNALRIRKCRGEIECRYFGTRPRFNVNYLRSLFSDEPKARKE